MIVLAAVVSASPAVVVFLMGEDSAFLDKVEEVLEPVPFLVVLTMEFKASLTIGLSKFSASSFQSAAT